MNIKTPRATRANHCSYCNKIIRNPRQNKSGLCNNCMMKEKQRQYYQRKKLEKEDGCN
jgi:predicted nucleic acid-binding Zn ribbon protein